MFEFEGGQLHFSSLCGQPERGGWQRTMKKRKKEVAI
jgi:hypothetical protein